MHFRHRLCSLLIGMVLCLLPASAQEQKKEPPPEPYAMRIHLGVNDKKATSWNVSLKPTDCEITGMSGWHFSRSDSISAEKFTCKCRTTPRKLTSAQKKDDSVPKAIPIGLDVFLTGRPDRLIEVKSSTKVSMAIELKDLAYGQPIAHESQSMTVERIPPLFPLAGKETEADAPSVAVDSRGATWASWIEYGPKDQKIVLGNLSASGVGETYEVVDAPRGLFSPLTAVDDGDRIWVIFGMEAKGNMDLYARNLNAGKWMPIDRVSEHPAPDIHPSIAVDEKRRIWVVWQSARNGNYDIFLRHVHDATWSAEFRVTDSLENEWTPAICINKDGVAFIAYDVYDNGDYDIALKKFVNEKPEPAGYVAQTAGNETHASLLCDPKGRIWMAWEESPGNWGRNYPSEEGTPLHARKTIRYKVMDTDGVKSVGGLFDKFPYDLKEDNEAPRLAVDKRGCVWMGFRHLTGTFEPRSPSDPGPTPFWESYVTYCAGKGWESPLPLPQSAGRVDQLPALRTDAANNLWVVWGEDGREYGQETVVPGKRRVYGALIKPPKEMAEPEPGAGEEKAAEEKPIPKKGFRYSARIGQKEFRLLFADLNRRTEISWEAKSGWGSYEDLFRYALDAAGLQVAGVTEDFGDAALPWPWQRAQEACSLYAIPKAFVPLWGYTRAPGYPVGHRLVLVEATGLPPIGVFYSEPKARKVAPDDSKSLWAALKKQPGGARSLTIPTTPASKRGTDWRDADPTIERLVEIYSGAHWSYEQEGAPLAAEKGAKTIYEGFQAEGFVANALAKKIKLGFVAGSGEGSAGRAFTGIYAPEVTTKDVFDALAARRTYAATDRIILDCRVGDHFMGEEFSISEKPKFDIRVIGTAKIKEIAVLKNGKTIHTTKPEHADTSYAFTDDAAESGKEAYYYVRVVQEDGKMAWASPVWITVK